MADQWYYASGGNRLGPVPFAQLRQLAAGGRLQPTDLVWQAGTPNWVPASSVASLFPPAFTQAPPGGFTSPPPGFSPHPQPGFPTAPPAKSKLPWILGGVAALGLVCCGVPVACFGLTGLGIKKQQDDQGKKVEQEKPIEASASDILQAYEDNEVRANDKYKGRVVQITGTIDRIREGHVVFLARGGFTKVHEVDCYFEDNERSSLASLSQGQRVAIKGLCDGKGAFDVNVKRCKVVK